MKDLIYPTTPAEEIKERDTGSTAHRRVVLPGGKWIDVEVPIYEFKGMHYTKEIDVQRAAAEHVYWEEE